MIKVGCAALVLVLVGGFGIPCRVGSRAIASDNGLSFPPERGVTAESAGLRSHDADVPGVRGVAYVYATFAMGSDNPSPYVGGRPKGAQYVILGEKKGERFTPAVKFGLADAFRGGQKGERTAGASREGDRARHPRRPPGAVLTASLSDGSLDYFGAYARPNTPYDFKIRVDLAKGRLTAWVSGRGDDQWILLAEDARLMHPVSAINHVRVEQCAGAAGIRDLHVRSEKWDPGERVRPHPLAKRDRVVRPDRGYRFRQPMRSTWRLSGRHVAISRKPNFHHAFPDVALAGPKQLVAVWSNKSHSGGTGGFSVARSEDLGKTWSEPLLVHPGRANCPRIQRLKDGTLLVFCDVLRQRERQTYLDVVLYESQDGGKTWGNRRWIRAQRTGSGGLYVPSRVLELPDGSWLLATSSYGGTPSNITERSYVEVHRSEDRGRTWKLHATIRAAAPHHIDEPSIVALPDGRLVIYAREWRYDGLPGLKAVSKDGGKSWEVRELPFSITGRVCAGLLDDGRAMITFRTGIGRAQALWAWVGDPDDPTGFQPGGTHYNDRYTVGLKNGALHIDNDGVRGQFTRYFLRPADTAESTVDVTVEVKVISNHGRAATLSVPYVGKVRFFPDHVELAHDPSVSVRVAPDEFHVYRVVRKGGTAELHVDGNLAIRTDKIDLRTWKPDGAFRISVHPLAFGNGRDEADAHTNVNEREIGPEVTGYSIWRRVEETLDDPTTGKRAVSWSAKRDGFPDQYQSDHIIEVEATAVGGDQGYSGWVSLDDGRIFVVNYTDDTAPMVRWDPYDSGILGIPWIRGTYLLRSDLPTTKGVTDAKVKTR